MAKIILVIIILWPSMGCQKPYVYTGRPNLHSKQTAVETVMRNLEMIGCKDIDVNENKMIFSYHEKGYSIAGQGSIVLVRKACIPYKNVHVAKARCVQETSLNADTYVDIEWAEGVLHLNFRLGNARDFLDAVETLRGNSRPSDDESRWGLTQKGDGRKDVKAMSDLEKKLLELQSLYEKKLISEEEYQEMRKKLIKAQ